MSWQAKSPTSRKRCEKWGTDVDSFLRRLIPGRSDKNAKSKDAGEGARSIYFPSVENLAK
jgi:hypothetical protein